MRSSDDLSLYVFEGCGYCEDVRAALRELDLAIEERNIRRDPAHMRELAQARGRTTVPVLRIEGEGQDRWMGESKEIIRYLYERFGEGRAPPRLRPDLVARLLMWGLFGGAVLSSEPTRSGLFAAALSVGAVRSASLAWRGRSWVQASIAGAFLTGAVSVALSASQVAEIPWWWIALAVSALVLGASLVRRSPPAPPR